MASGACSTRASYRRRLAPLVESLAPEEGGIARRYHAIVLTESDFDNYSFLKAAFWPAAKDLTWPSDRFHPLAYLLRSTSDAAKQTAPRTDRAIGAVMDADPNWALAKVKVILSDHDHANVTATLGEFRAYADLLGVWHTTVKAASTGSDFIIDRGDYVARVEVFTPQPITELERSSETLATKRVKMRTVAEFPFGRPKRPIDTVEGEAVSKFARAKEQEHQIDEASVGILWLDLEAPEQWVFDLGSAEALPLSVFAGVVTSGPLWTAWYGSKGMPVYDDLSVCAYPTKVYRLEYDGRFRKGSKLSFVVASTRQDHIVFENPWKGPAPRGVYQRLHRLARFNSELSWLDWPVNGQLLPRVDAAMQVVKAYETAFDDAWE